MEELLYKLELKVNELRKEKLNKIKYNKLTIKELLDLGFDNCFIKIEDKWYNLGFKYEILENIFGYESNDFGVLGEKQLNCLVEFVDSEISDYNYLQVSVELVNKEDKKYFE